MDNSNKNDELVAPFMVAEFETLTSRILNIEQTKATRINFYIVIVSAAIGGLSLATQFQMTTSLNPLIVPALSSVVFLLGIAILNENVELASKAVFLYRRAGRIRCWFQDKNPNILPYLAWTPGDDTPPFKDDPGYGTFAGKDSILWLGNSVSGAILLLSILLSYSSLLIIASCVIAAIIFFAIWISQNKYIDYLMNKYERLGSEKGRIHFPRNERTYKVNKNKTN
jgi:hypothetical protein